MWSAFFQVYGRAAAKELRDAAILLAIFVVVVLLLGVIT